MQVTNDFSATDYTTKLGKLILIHERIILGSYKIVHPLPNPNISSKKSKCRNVFMKCVVNSARLVEFYDNFLIVLIL